MRGRRSVLVVNSLVAESRSIHSADGDWRRALVDRLAQRALNRRRLSLVYVDAASFNGVRPRAETSLLSLQNVGVPIAVLRRGDDLAAKLSGDAIAGAARA